MLVSCSFLLKAFAILVLCQSFGMADILNNRNVRDLGRHVSRNDYREPNHVTTRLMRTREPDRKDSYRRDTLEWLNSNARRLEIIPRRETLKLDTRRNRRDMRSLRADRNEYLQYPGSLRYTDKSGNSIRDQRDRRNIHDEVTNRRISRSRSLEIENMRTQDKRSSDTTRRYFRVEERKERTNRAENLRKTVRNAETSNRSSRFMLERVPIERMRTLEKQDNIRERRQKRSILSEESRRNSEVYKLENRRTQNMLIKPVEDTIQNRVLKVFRKDMSRINFRQEKGQKLNYMKKSLEGDSVSNFFIYKVFTTALQGLLVVSMFKNSDKKMNCVLSLFSKSGIKI